MSQYRVNLEIFAGPLDLLLYLVRKDEVDIYDIPISNITSEYIKYIEMLKLFDIELAGDFLVMAATLMEIKSAMLLPGVEEESEEESQAVDPRKELVRQLLEYKKFKDAANLLEDSAVKRSERFTRPDAIISKLKPQQEPELDLDEVSIWSLLEAFDAMMQATGRLQSYEHITDDTPIDLYQIEILHRLQTEGPMTFKEVFRDKTNRLQMIGVFLAMLELMKSELIWAEQPEGLGEIRIKALTDVPAEKAVQDAIYKNQEEDQLLQQRAQEMAAEAFEEESLSHQQNELPDDELLAEDSQPHRQSNISDETAYRTPIPIVEIQDNKASPIPQLNTSDLANENAGN